MSHSRWALGHERLQGPGCPILGPHHWQCADDAPRAQEFRLVFLVLSSFAPWRLTSFGSNCALQSSRLPPALQATCSLLAAATCGQESGGTFYCSILSLSCVQRICGGETNPVSLWKILHLYRTVMGLMMGSFGANVTSFVCLIHNVVASLKMVWVCLCVRPLEGSVSLSHRNFRFSFPR